MELKERFQSGTVAATVKSLHVFDCTWLKVSRRFTVAATAVR